MIIKHNPYSEALKAALQAVGDITSPDFLLLPVDPTVEMLTAGAKASGASTSQLRDAYMAMVLAWTSKPSE